MYPGILHRIGRLGRPWGHRGDLIVQLEGRGLDELPVSGWFFVDIDGQKVPFPYGGLQDKGRAGVLVKFDGMDDPQSVGILVGRDLYAPPGVLEDDGGPDHDPESLIGMRVHDERHGDLGEVAAIEGTDENPVLVVRDGEREVMVPFAEELVVRMDVEGNSLLVRTPPGLVEMYRGA